MSTSDLSQLTVLLVGPDGTAYADGIWKVHIKLPSDYPNSAPKATFRTKIWHPNVDDTTGAICVDTLKRDWRPELTVRDILVTISCLLIHPNPDSALNTPAAQLFQEDYEAFAKKVRLMTDIQAAVPDAWLDRVKQAKLRGADGCEDEMPSNAAKRRKIQTTKAVPSLPEEGLFPTGPAPVSMVDRSVVANRHGVRSPSRPESHHHQQGVEHNDQPDLRSELESELGLEPESESESESEASKENDPSRSPDMIDGQPPLATTVSGNTGTTTTSTTPSPRRHVLGKRPLADLPIPFGPGVHHNDNISLLDELMLARSRGGVVGGGGATNEGMSPSQQNIINNTIISVGDGDDGASRGLGIGMVEYPSGRSQQQQQREQEGNHALENDRGGRNIRSPRPIRHHQHRRQCDGVGSSSAKPDIFNEYDDGDDEKEVMGGMSNAMTGSLSKAGSIIISTKAVLKGREVFEAGEREEGMEDIFIDEDLAAAAAAAVAAARVDEKGDYDEKGSDQFFNDHGQPSQTVPTVVTKMTEKDLYEGHLSWSSTSTSTSTSKSAAVPSSAGTKIGLEVETETKMRMGTGMGMISLGPVAVVVDDEFTTMSTNTTAAARTNTVTATNSSIKRKKMEPGMVKMTTNRNRNRPRTGLRRL